MDTITAILNLFVYFSLALTLVFPIYIVLFVVRRVKAKRQLVSWKPSVLTFVVYLVVIAFTLSIFLPLFDLFVQLESAAEAGNNLVVYDLFISNKLAHRIENIDDPAQIWIIEKGPQPFILAVACFWLIWCLFLDERRWKRALKEKQSAD